MIKPKKLFKDEASERAFYAGEAPAPVAEAPKPAPAPERTVCMYGYAPSGLAGHYAVYRLELPASDVRLVQVAEKLPKRVAFERILYLARQEIFRNVVHYKRPPQDGAA